MRRGITCLFLIATLIYGSQTIHGGKLYLENFLIKNSSLVREDGNVISSENFQPVNWYPCKIPSTVLNCLVHNKVYPEPYIGTNNLKIPDSCEAYNAWYGLLKFSHLPGKRNPWKDSYWFRTEFKMGKISPESFIWLVLQGINYRAEVWLNGHKIADREKTAGMFRHLRFNITKYIQRGKNFLALKIYPLDFPGLLSFPLKPNINGGLTGDIGKNVTMQCSAGWDWMPPVRDRNMGIWQRVYVEETGPVIIRWPRIITDLLLPKTSPARLTISAELINLSRKPQKGKLRVIIGKIRLEKKITLKPEQHLKIVFSPKKYKKLVIRHPRLWWPAGYGRPELYSMLMEYETKGRLSDARRINFGIREISTGVTYVNGWARRDFYINGRRIFIRGGAWVPDMMLRRSPKRIYDELRLIKEANLNLVRIWGGGVTPPDEFFDICDRLGLLVWHDFWITGDCQGTWGKGSKNWPVEPEVFLENARDVVLRLRNHPSLLVWTAGNEGYPGKRIYVPLRDQIISELDGTRPFLPSSGYSMPPKEWGLSLPDNQPSGVYSGGPYHWIDPANYYEKVNQGKDWLFKDEVGTPSMISINSIAKFITDFSPDPTFPIPFFNRQWRYHFALYDLREIKRYGAPQTLQDLIVKAQLMGADAYRAIFEATNKEMGKVSGIMLWKINSAWPEFRWQIYDYFLKPIPAYYYIKRALAPLHVQLALDNFDVGIVNNSREPKWKLKITVKVYNSKFKKVMEKNRELNIPPYAYKTAFSLRGILNSDFHFVALEVKDERGKILSDNFYWISPNNDYTALESLESAKIDLHTELERFGEKYLLKLNIKNTSKAPALFVNLALLKGTQGEEALPTFWSDNYFTLLPSEEKEITASVDLKFFKGFVPHLIVEGWNIYPLEINLHTGKILNLKPEIFKIKIPEGVKNHEKFPLCFTVKNPAIQGAWITSFPIWIEQNGKIRLTHVGLRGQEEKRVCIVLNYNSKK